MVINCMESISENIVDTRIVINFADYSCIKTSLYLIIDFKLHTTSYASDLYFLF